MTKTSAAANTLTLLRAVGAPVFRYPKRMRIAAIAGSRGAAVATRNTGDFSGCGVTVIDPWR
jgi:predicted nucleic acid-binding protein